MVPKFVGSNDCCKINGGTRKSGEKLKKDKSEKM